MRMFVALVPPESALEHLEEFLDPRRGAAAFRWTSPEQVHVTLAFAEDVPERSLDDLGDRLERAAARRTAFDTRITGGGAFPNAARARVLWAGLDLTEDSRTELARRISEADVALSVCPSETFGLAVLEALACGTPVVTADVGGARELVDAHSGAWAAPEPEALADAVLDLASRPEATRRRQARARAEQYPWSRTVEQMLALHADLSGAARRTA